MTPTNPNALPSGFEIGGFKVDRVIGRGAFGTVYGGVRVADGARAAVKVMTGRVLELTGGNERFRREAELSRRLAHPNIVRVLDAGVDGGLLFTAFELLEGYSLQDEMARAGPMPAARAAMIVAEVLAGLEEAHRVGIIHRDIKPANLFLALSPRGQEVKILDFGVAKSTNPNTVAGLTRDGIALGTPAYMAPEQLAGHPASPATDLFALGIVTAELLMGRFVYGPDVSAIHILNERIGGGRVLLPQSVVEGALGPIVLRATSPHAAQRFQSAAEMRAMILSALSAMPVDALPRSSKALGATFPLSPAFAPTAVVPIWSAMALRPRATLSTPKARAK